MKFIKYLGALAFIVLGLFLFVSNFSIVASSYECIGEIVSGEKQEPVTVYIALERYRWWVGLWNDSDGNMQLEIPNEDIDYYHHTVEVRSQIQIYGEPNEMKGYFSTLSKTLALKTSGGFFDGKCVVIK